MKKLLIALTEEQQKKLKEALNVDPGTKCEYLGIKLTEDMLSSLRKDDDDGVVIVYGVPDGGGSGAGDDDVVIV